MPPSKDNIPRRRKLKLTNLPYEQEVFDLQKYLDNPYLIEKLHKDMNLSVLYIEQLTLKIKASILNYQKLELQNYELQFKLDEMNRELTNKKANLENNSKELQEKNKKLEAAQKSFHKLEMDKNEVDIKLKGVKQFSFLTYITSAIAGFAVTLGGNFIVGTSNTLAGWILAAIGVAVGIVAYFMSRRGI